MTDRRLLWIGTALFTAGLILLVVYRPRGSGDEGWGGPPDSISTVPLSPVPDEGEGGTYAG